MINDNIDETSIDGLEENIDFLSRFACLIEGVNVACDAAERMGIDPEKSNAWIKPLAFQKYVDERSGDMKYKIQKYLRGETEDEIYTR